MGDTSRAAGSDRFALMAESSFVVLVWVRGMCDERTNWGRGFLLLDRGQRRVATMREDRPVMWAVIQP